MTAAQWFESISCGQQSLSRTRPHGRAPYGDGHGPDEADLTTFAATLAGGGAEAAALAAAGDQGRTASRVCVSPGAAAVIMSISVRDSPGPAAPVRRIDGTRLIAHRMAAVATVGRRP